jgi:hypothetical protein
MINLCNVKPALKIVKPQQATEIIQLRRGSSKTFDLGNGEKRVSTLLGAVHYKDNYQDNAEDWKEIDLTIDEDNRVTSAPYNVEIFSDRVGYRYLSKMGGTVEVELVEIDNVAVDNKRFVLRREYNQIFWDNVHDAIDLKILLRPLSVEIFKQLKSESAKRHFRWRIKESKTQQRFRRATFGQDAETGNLEISTAITNIPVISDYNEYYYDEIWTGRVSRIINRATRQREWTNTPVYPIIIDAATSENIAANVDDGYEINSTSPWRLNTTFGGSGNWFGGYYAAGTTYANGGVRFRTLGVPQGATIVNATLTINVTNVAITGGATPQFTIYGDDVDDAPLWANNSRPSQITQTTASQNWSPASTGTFTVSITSIVKEIIDRGGWSSGNDIRFGIINAFVGGGGNNAGIYVYDYNQGAAGAVQLDVTYTAGRVPRSGVTIFQIPAIV